MSAPPLSDRRIVWAVSLHQLVSWGTLYLAFPAFVGAMEAELGWSRAAMSGALTLGLLVAGLAAVPVGRWADRRGGHGPLVLGAAGGIPLLLAWAAVDSLAAFYAIWVGLGLVHAMCLADTANGVVLANARDARRTLGLILLVTGFSSSLFVPLAALLVEALGWRATLAGFAALQAGPVLVAGIGLRGARGSLSGAAPGRAGAPLRAALRRPAFRALALAHAAQAFMVTGLTFHILPLLDEAGMPLAAALVIVAMHGPCQVAARALLLHIEKRRGGRAGEARRLGIFAFGLLPPAMLLLALSPPSLGLTMLYGLFYGVGNGLITIVRATGTAEILGREGFAQISGAITLAQVLPRTLSPLALGLAWEVAGGYGAVPWLLLGVTLLALAAFVAAARAPAGPGGSPAPPAG